MKKIKNMKNALFAGKQVINNAALCTLLLLGNFCVIDAGKIAKKIDMMLEQQRVKIMLAQQNIKDKEKCVDEAVEDNVKEAIDKMKNLKKEAKEVMQEDDKCDWNSGKKCDCKRHKRHNAIDKLKATKEGKAYFEKKEECYHLGYDRKAFKLCPHFEEIKNSVVGIPEYQEYEAAEINSWNNCFLRHLIKSVMSKHEKYIYDFNSGYLVCGKNDEIIFNNVGAMRLGFKKSPNNNYWGLKSYFNLWKECIDTEVGKEKLLELMNVTQNQIINIIDDLEKKEAVNLKSLKKEEERLLNEQRKRKSEKLHKDAGKRIAINRNDLNEAIDKMNNLQKEADQNYELYQYKYDVKDKITFYHNKYIRHFIRSITFNHWHHARCTKIWEDDKVELRSDVDAMYMGFYATDRYGVNISPDLYVDDCYGIDEVSKEELRQLIDATRRKVANIIDDLEKKQKEFVILKELEKKEKKQKNSFVVNSI